MSCEFGFIITRHVTSEQTNKLWLECVSQIRTFYPDVKIVIIDDNSNYEFIKHNAYDLERCIIIQSEYIGRGELLPYYYLQKYKFFKRACIIHDSIFVQERIKIPNDFKNVVFLWEFEHTWNNYEQERALASKLNNSEELLNLYRKYDKWNGCLGVMSIIELTFLEYIWEKYNMENLLYHIICRNDRCYFERVFSLICCFENDHLKVYNNLSLYGNIHNFIVWGFTYDQYINHKETKQLCKPVYKVWSGR